MWANLILRHLDFWVVILKSEPLTPLNRTVGRKHVSDDL
jgi:hypothetical protein